MYSKLSECEQRKPCIWGFLTRKMASLLLGPRYLRALGSDKLVIIIVIIIIIILLVYIIIYISIVINYRYY